MLLQLAYSLVNFAAKSSRFTLVVYNSFAEKGIEISNFVMN